MNGCWVGSLNIQPDFTEWEWLEWLRRTGWL